MVFIRQVGNAWVLGTDNSLYAIAIGEDSLPVQRYWGMALPESDWPAMLAEITPRWRTSSSRPSETQDEVLVAGGLRWGAVGLQVELADGRRELELRLTGSRIEEAEGGATLVLSLEDIVAPLELRLCYRIRAGHDVIERWSELEYRAEPGERALVCRFDSANWPMPGEDAYRISSVHGHWGAENQLERRDLPVGELTMTSRTGTTGHHANPWVMIDSGDSTETDGRVWTVALAWSGTWRIVAQRRPEGSVSVTAGAGHEGVTRSIVAGASIITPPSYGLFCSAGFGATSRALHRFADQVLRPSPGRPQPVLYNSWEATGFDVSEQGQMALADRAAELGVELFVVDDGWFGQRTADAAGLGDWHPNPTRFPDGLHALVKHVRSKSMGFGLWVEPEMVNRESDLYTEHPDWVLHYPELTRRELRNQLVLNFARADVQEWALGWLSGLLREYDLDYIKWDMNRPFSQAGWPANTEDPGILWFDHTRAVYRIMEELRAIKPGLLIESCSGGGGRVDFGMIGRADLFWTSDNTDALDRQRIQDGFSQVYPAITMSNWVTDSPNPITRRSIPLTYRFHVAMAGMLGIGGNLAEWSKEDLQAAESFVTEYKSIREIVQFGELYRLGGEPGRELSAVQFVHGAEVVIIAYEPRRSLARHRGLFRLAGLDPASQYVDARNGERFSGRWLTEQGLDLWHGTGRNEPNGGLRFSRDDYASTLIRLRAHESDAEANVVASRRV